MAEERYKYTEVRIRTLPPPVISEIGRFLAWGILAAPPRACPARLLEGLRLAYPYTSSFPGYSDGATKTAY